MKKPNVVYVFADQWRAQAVGYAGDPNVKTPNIDKLSKESVNFSNTISGCPICTPYRASLLTGQNPLTTGLFMNDLCLSNDAVSIAEAYASSGYETAYIGKWHIDGHGRDKYIPKERRQGFDYWKVLECSHDYNESYYYEGDDKKIKKWEGYDAFAQTKDAINYLKDRKETDKPFILMLSYGGPHNPYETAPQEFIDMYPLDDIKTRPNVPADCEKMAKTYLQGYYAHTSALDRCVGEIDEALKDLGMTDNTIFVVTSDHGDSVMSQCTTKSGNINKQRPYDESIKVPFLLRYPNALGKEEKMITTPFSTPDIMPTLLDLSGVSIPETVEGISYAEAITSNKKVEREGVLIAGYVPFADWRPENGGREYRGVRTERYTYAKTLKGPWLLFDNQTDPYQLDNLIENDKHKEIQNHLEKLLETILIEQGDEFLPGDKLCLKYGYHSLVKKSNAIPFNKGQEWFDVAEELREKNN